MVHWTKKREAESRIRSAYLVGLQAGITDLIRYLESEKFQDDTTVQVKDVILRIRDAKNFADGMSEEQRRIEKDGGNLE